MHVIFSNMMKVRVIFRHSCLKLISKRKVQFRNFSVTTSCCKKLNNRPPIKYEKFQKESGSKEESDLVDIENNSDEEAQYIELANRAFRTPDNGHNVFVIQPYVKWGPKKKTNTTPDLQLAESCTLIKTLNNWQVKEELIVSLLSLDKSTLFGKGNLEKLKCIVSRNKEISAVFISVNVLRGPQRVYLENLFKIPVYDRYSIVMQIFREHAVSREAKLQLKLAEIPYLRARVRQVDPSSHYVGCGGLTYLEYQHNLLKNREKKLANEIQTLRSHRELIRKKRQRVELPVIAVVGYTNAGKTTLIKALTDEQTMMPKNVLFATLDVTVHAGYLPSGLKVLYVDTIGFISDIPTTLIESFVATLEDALLADLIVHVRDASHPDALAQNEHVYNTLRGLSLSNDLMNNIVEVGNKIDLAPDLNESYWTGAILTSAARLQGIENLKVTLEEAVLKATGRLRMQIRVYTGGEEYQWLRRECTICNIQPDTADPNFSILSVIISPLALSKFKHNFITKNR